MNKNRITFILLVLSVWICSGCQKEDFFDFFSGRKDKEVNTQFAFNIASGAAPRTRQTAEATNNENSQGNVVFRGISNAKLMTMHLAGADGKIMVDEESMVRVYDLSSVLSSGSVSPTASRRVIEMSLPLQTNLMVFYGKAPAATTPDIVYNSGSSSTDFSNPNAYDCYGHLDEYEVSLDKNSAVFQLGKRLSDDDYPKFLASEKLLAGLFTLIMNTSLPSGTEIVSSESAGDGLYNYSVTTTKQIYWKDYATKNNGIYQSPYESNHDAYPLEEKLAELYVRMTTIHSDEGELRAGSGEATMRIFNDLWSVVNSVRCATPFSAAEAVAKRFAVLISTRIGLFFDGTIPSNGLAVTGIKYKSLDDIRASFKNLTGIGSNTNYWPQNAAAATYKPSETELNSIPTGGLAQFPFNYNLPRGGVHTKFVTEAECFEYPQSFNTSAMANGAPSYDAGSGGYNARSYYYPAEILYFANSPVRVSDEEHAVSDYPNGTAAWHSTANTVWGDAGWKQSGTHVTSSTRSVAMQYDVNYGVALLETKVAYAAANLQDNRHAVMKMSNPSLLDNEEPNKTITVSGSETGSMFLLTGIIIGGQYQNVGWNYLPVKTPGEDKKANGFIYDKAIPSGSQTIPAYSGTIPTSEPNYTVVFDNYNEEKGAANQDVVYVALEFKNNTGQDFYGNCDIVRDQGYFYIIGALDPTKMKENSINWPSEGYHVIPPYETSKTSPNYGKSLQIPRVFIQDFMTSATFKLGEYSLQYAYLTVPDLRASSLTMGLSVDLNWSQGPIYEDVILGGNTQYPGN